MGGGTTAPQLEQTNFTSPTNAGVLGGALGGNVQSSWQPELTLPGVQSPLLKTGPSYTEGLLDKYNVPNLDENGLYQMPEKAPTIMENFQNAPTPIDVAAQNQLSEWDKGRQKLYDKGMKAADRMSNANPQVLGKIAGGVGLAGQAADMIGDTLAKGAAAEDAARRKANETALTSAYTTPLNAFSKAPTMGDFKTEEAEVSGKDVGASTLKGLGTGAAIGTSLGSIVPVIGNAVGGLIGAAVGTLGGLFAGIFGGRKRAKKENEDTQRKAEQLYNQRLEAFRAARRGYESRKNAADIARLRQQRDLERQRFLESAGDAANARQTGLINSANVALKEQRQPTSYGLDKYRTPLFSFQ